MPEVYSHLIIHSPKSKYVRFFGGHILVIVPENIIDTAPFWRAGPSVRCTYTALGRVRKICETKIGYSDVLLPIDEDVGLSDRQSV